jgi:hypothetical protein
MKNICDDCKASYANEVCWLSYSKNFEYRINIRIAMSGLLASMFSSLLSTSWWTTGPHLQSLNSTSSDYIPNTLAVLLAGNTTRACLNVILIILCFISMAVLWGSITVLLFVTVVDPGRKLWKFPASIIYMFFGGFMVFSAYAMDSEDLDGLLVTWPFGEGVFGLFAAVSTKWKLVKETKTFSIRDVEQGKKS